MAYVFAFACAITIITRIYGGYVTLKQQESITDE
jgi:uncharacterized membrane protein